MSAAAATPSGGASWLSGLFGLDTVRFGAENVSLEWARPMPAWLWVLVAAALVLAAGWTYWRLIAPRTPRLLLAGARTLLLLTLLAMLAGPQLVQRTERVERDWVVVLADRSRSMTLADVDTSRGGPRDTRETQLADAVRAAMPTLDALGREREVLWLGFDAGAFDLATPSGAIDLGDPEGRSTRVGRALEQALRRVAAKPIAGVVLLSDGRSADAIPKAVERRLEAERVPVFTVPLGSPTPIADTAVARVEGPTLAFVGDIVPIAVRLERAGADSDTTPATPVRVELVDRDTGLVLDAQDAEFDPDNPNTARTTLTYRPGEPGEGRWLVRLAGDTRDLIPANDSRSLDLELVDRPLRVVYVEGYPRWEYRYLKNLLLRESSIVSSALLLATNRQYLQEGDVVLDRLPTSPEEWAEIDVVILGDVRPDVFGENQLRQLRDHIAERGAGLIWVGGPAHTPGGWGATPLAELLPFVSTGESAPAPPARDPVTMAPTELAANLGLLRLGDPPRPGAVGGWPERLSDPRTGWSVLRWSQRIDRSRLKPTTEVLAVALSPDRGSLTAQPQPTDNPLVLSMRYGAGRVLYVATDEIWRWRYARGEALTERFWIPLVRYLGRESLGRGGQSATLEVTPREAGVDQPVRVAVRLLDQSLLDAAPSRLRLRVQPREAAASGSGGPFELSLSREDIGDARAAGAGVATFSTTWLPDQPGVYTLEPGDPLLAGLGLEAEAVVLADDDELRRPETDHARLAALSERTGGRVLDASDLTGLPDLLPNRQRRIESAPDVESLWDRPIVLIWLMVLLTLEWVGRRLVRLA